MEIKNLFYKDAQPFVTKRDFNWLSIKIIALIILVIFIIGVLCLPSAKTPIESFHEKTESGNVISSPTENDPTQEALKQFQASKSNSANVPASIDYLFNDKPTSYSSEASTTKQDTKDRKGTMIISRGGNDSKTQLFPGTRFLVKTEEKIIVANQAMPIIGIVSKDVLQESAISIPAGSKLIGDIAFNDTDERAQVTWKSIIFPDGRERPLSGIGVGLDGQVGVNGEVKSEALKNAVGQTITTFIGAYAEGSMSKGQNGSSEGGSQNGLKNAVAETAKDRANSFGEEMSKEKKWIELSMGAEFYTVLNQPFLFRDPGATYGK